MIKRPIRVNNLKELKNPKHGLPPLIYNNPKLIIIGTFPGKDSREHFEYYFDKTNRFWDIIGNIFNVKNLKLQTYAKKREILLENNIGLWDLINYAEVSGSQDKDLTKVLYNELKSFLEYKSSVKIVLFNGKYTSQLAKFEIPSIFSKDILFKSLQSTSRSNGHFNNGVDWKNFFKSLVKKGIV